MLEIGKVYYVKVHVCGHEKHWLFKKCASTRVAAGDRITSCRYCICLDTGYSNINATAICHDASVIEIKPANRNHIAIWNRTFNDNIEMV